jgi:hypothetical protein
MRKITGYVTLTAGETIPEGAIFDQVTVEKFWVGCDESVPMGLGDIYEHRNVFGFVLTETEHTSDKEAFQAYIKKQAVGDREEEHENTWLEALRYARKN